MGALALLAGVLGLGFAVSRRNGGRRQLPARWRKLFLVAHVTSAVGWLAIVVGLIAFAVVGVRTTDPQTARVAYGAMAIFDAVFLGYASPIALATGIVLSLGTRWGLLQHWWVATKFVTTIVLMVTGVFVMHVNIGRAAADAAAVSGVDAAMQVREVLLAGCVISAAALLGAVVLSIFKPWGRTSLGHRAARRSSTPAIPGGLNLMPATPAGLDVTVVETATVADGVRTLRLAHPDNATLPPWQPGAHIELVLPSGKVRQYSLIGDPAHRDSYRIAVRHIAEGRGGSAEVHRLQPGQVVAVRGPRNRFPLVLADAYLFLAGGIGITPLLPMIEQVARSGAPWQLIYAGHSLESMPFATELCDRHANHVRIMVGRPDLETALRSAPQNAAVYCCGPEGMLAAVESLMPQACPTGSLHTERFNGRDAVDTGGEPFEVELVRTGQVLAVPAQQRLLDVLREATPATDASCEEGFCGTCVVPVLAGTPHHRDEVPGPHDDVIYPCVSRASGRLVLDL